MNLISQSTEYALRSVVYLAVNTGRLYSASAISEAVDVPTHYLGKVLKLLVRAGIFSARRGRRGGYGLAVPPEKLTVLDIVNAVDPLEHVRRCPLRRLPADAPLCPLHTHIQKAIQGVEEAFRSTTIADLADPQRTTPLCHLTTDVSHV